MKILTDKIYKNPKNNLPVMTWFDQQRDDDNDMVQMILMAYTPYQV